jgi:hypothetical protein
MKLRDLVRSFPLWAFTAVVAAGCNSGDDCPKGQIWQGDLYGPGYCRPENGCRSWTIFIAPEYPPPGFVSDRSQSPVIADLEVGSRMAVGVDFEGLDPSGCSDGVLASRETWRTSDPGVLRVDEARLHSAIFVAVAPGTARVFADGLNQPGGRTGSIELSICTYPSTREKTCARMPLVIRVVP